MMPGHFTHIYTARRVADLLAEGEFDDWPEGFGLSYSAAWCGQTMRDWEKFTAIGAIGPDLFYFSQDYNTNPVGRNSDALMLSLAAYYFYDNAAENDWEPLLVILDEVSSPMADIIRFLIKLDKIWQDISKAWDNTVGPFVAVADGVMDDLTGGLISEFGVAVDALLVAVKTLGEQELLTFSDIFSKFDTCVNKGWSESAFLWSDMSHYRRTTLMCRNLVRRAEELRSIPDVGEERFQQAMAFALGYITHVGTDTIGHSFVNEQCGGPYRNHPQRHHLIENHIDAWNYRQCAAGGAIRSDPIGANDVYPNLSMSGLQFAVQLTPEEPRGATRPGSLPDDQKGRKEALDIDGELPLWLCELIVHALVDTHQGHAPRTYGGSGFQRQIDAGMLDDVVRRVAGHGLTGPFRELLDAIAPPPDFEVPEGFPLPWQIGTMYRLMISYYRISFVGSWELSKPRTPRGIIMPPWSDVEGVLQPPDFSGVTSSDPASDVCGALAALFEWAAKVLAAVGKLIGDLIKMAASPASYLFRLGVYGVSMLVWDVITKTHEVLAHTGFLSPHGTVRYDDGELRLPNEIDLPLITLGGTVDAAFREALAAAVDPFANLDRDQAAIHAGHAVVDPRYPYTGVRRYHGSLANTDREPWEFRRPWAYPVDSRLGLDDDPDHDIIIATPTETYDAAASEEPLERAKPHPPLRPGPYPAGIRPDQAFYRLGMPVNREVRAQYEAAPSPAATDRLNAAHLLHDRRSGSPLGDMVPFSAYLIGRIANGDDYTAQFNLDSDRAYAYLTWDWIRGTGDGGLQFARSETGFEYVLPNVPPPDAEDWDPSRPLQLRYLDRDLRAGASEEGQGGEVR